MRLALIVAIVIANGIYYPEVMRSTLGLALTLAAPLYAAGMLALAFKVQGSWIAWASCALDVSLISITLFLFVVTGEPLGAVNNKFLFETYSFVVINSILRFDWRLCAFSAALAFVQFLGITSYVAAHWDLATLQSPVFGAFQFRDAHLQNDRAGRSRRELRRGGKVGPPSTADGRYGPPDRTLPAPAVPGAD